MTITLRGQDNSQSNGATELTVNRPTGTVDGDLLIMFCATDDNAAAVLTPPSGWTQISTGTETDFGPSATDFSSEMWWRQASSEPTTYQVTQVKSDQFTLTIAAFYESGGLVDWTEEDNAFGKVDSANAITSPSVTGVANSLLYIGYPTDDDDQTLNVAPSGMTAVHSQLITTSTTQNAYYELVNAGAVTRTITYNNPNDGVHALAAIFSWTSASGDITGAIVDGIGLGDTFATTADLLASTTDGIGLSDAFAATAILNVAMAADGIGLSDDFGRVLDIVVATSADGIGLGDAFTRVLDIVVDVSADGIGLADTFATTAILLVSIPDGLGLGDTFANIADLLVSQTDEIGLGDTFIASVVTPGGNANLLRGKLHGGLLLGGKL